MKHNHKGSAIVIAVVIFMVLTIISGICFTIASSYYQRSFTSHYKRQAYITAKSVASGISKQIQANKEGFIPTSDKITFNDIKVDESMHSKDISAIITKKSDTTYIIVCKATAYTKEETIQLTLIKDNNKWKEVYSEEGETVYEEE